MGAAAAVVASAVEAVIAVEDGVAHGAAAAVVEAEVVSAVSRTVLES